MPFIVLLSEDDGAHISTDKILERQETVRAVLVCFVFQNGSFILLYYVIA